MQSATKKVPKKKSVISDAERREMVRQGMTRKKECEAKAVEIVHRLVLADSVQREWFRDAGYFLNENYYDDVVEERSCSQMCGYPLCPKPLSEAFTNQKYHISSQLNKVFDVTQRKKFCSNECFKSSTFYKEQLISSPLWLRDKKDEVRIKFHDEIKSEKEKPVLVGHGEEIPLSPMAEVASIIREVRAQKKEFVTEKKPVLTGSKSEESKLGDKASSSKNETPNEKLIKELENLNVKNCEENDNAHLKTTTNTEPVSESSKVELHDKALLNSSKPALSDHSELSKSQKELCDFSVENSSTDLNPSKVRFSTGNYEVPATALSPSPQPLEGDKKPVPAKIPKARLKQEQFPEVSAVDRVTRCVQEWYTVESVRVVYGNDYLRQLLRENNFAAPDLPDDDEISRNEIPDEISPEVRARYIRLCRQLDMMEIQETRDDQNLIQESAESSSSPFPRKKLPDYEQLRKDAAAQELKIVSYIQGKSEIPNDADRLKTSNDENSERMTHLPLVDKHAQGALRRRIVHEQLDRVFPDLLKLFGLFRRDINDVLRRLIFSFDFGPENISLKAQEWTLVAIIILKLISRSDKRILAEMNLVSSKKYLNMILLGYGTGLEFLELFLDTLHSDFKTIISKMNH